MSLLKRKNIVFVSVLLVATMYWNQCCDIHITDDYYVDTFNDFYYGPVLLCNPFCEQDPAVENIKKIFWNEKCIVAEQRAFDGMSENTWYIIIAKGSILMCCSDDTIVGPLTETEKNNYLETHSLGRLKKRYYIW